ncbi:MAG: BatA domain-containing protein [Bacteroidales bacterium]|nr:BatA domain-containing protein [Bacteroidales bacterium]
MKFVNPYILYGLFLLAIPIIIHLFNLRRYTVVYFTNVKFLKEIKEETRKKSKLKNILILISRLLLITCLVLAFARPYIPGETNRIISQRDFISIFIDNSFSMQTGDMQGNLLETAKKSALDLLKTYRNTDAFQILTNDFEATHQRIITQDECKELIADVDFSYTSRNLSEIIERQMNLSQTFSGKQRFLYIISDFQKNISDFSEIQTDSNVKIILIPLKATKVNNIFIDSLWFETPVKRLNQNLTLFARINNLSDADVEKVPAKLMINNQQRALNTFDCQANGSVIVEFPFKINQTGIHNASVEFPDYPVIYDDKMYFSFMVYEDIKILSINKNNENVYIKNLFRNDTAFTLIQMHENNVDYQAFSRYNLIILNALNNLSSGLGNEIIKYVENGGHLFLIPGEQTDLNNYNSFLSQLSPLALNNLDTHKVKMSYINLEHAIFKNVFERRPENMSFPDIKKHYPIISGSRTQGEDVLKLANGHTFLSSHRFGKGTFYIMSSPLDEAFSAFPLHPLFVPVVFNIALNSIRVSPLYYTLGVDNIIEMTEMTPSDFDILKVVHTESEIEFIPQQQNSPSGLNLNLHDQIFKSGNYIVKGNDKEISCFSFNCDRDESYLEYLSPKDIKQLIKENNLKNISVYDTSERSLSLLINDVDNGRKFWKLFVILALVFFVTETLLIRFWK